MSGGRRIGDLIEVPPIRTVIRLSEGRERSAEIAESFVFTAETSAHLNVIAEALSAGRGQGYFLQGDFGSGKSHFLAMLLTWLSERSGAEVLSAGHQGLEKAADARSAVLPVAVSLIDYRSDASLESILLENIERALREAGTEASLSPFSGFIEWLRDTVRDPENARTFRVLVGNGEPADLDAWISEHPRKAYAAGLRLAHQKALAAPTHLVEQRRENFLRVFEVMSASGFEGLFLMIDELSEFFRSKPSVQELNEDARTLQFLGELAGEKKLWIVAAVQESIEKTGDIAQGILRKIKDRFPVRLPLSTVHIHALIANRLVRKKPGALEEILRIYQGFRNRYATFRHSPDEFLQVYPVHPSTISLLSGLSDLFSQHRGIVDFVCSRLAGDERRHIPSVLDRPAEELLGPDSIYDHFSGRLAEVSAYNIYARHIVPHLDEQIDKALEDPEDRHMARRLVRMLVLYRIHPTAEVPNVATLAELAASSLDAPELNARFVSEVLLEPLAAASPFLTKREAGEPGESVYEISTEEDPGKTLDARVRRIAGEIAADDSRLLFESLLRAPESDSWPGAALIRDGLIREVDWFTSRRRVLVRFLHREEIEPRKLARQTRERNADFAAVFTIGEIGEIGKEIGEIGKEIAEGAEAVAFWRIPLPREEQGLPAVRELLAALLASEELSPSNPAQAPLIPLAGERVQRAEPAAVQAALTAFYTGGFTDPRIHVEAAVRQLRRFDGLLEAAGQVALADRYPRFPEVAPRRYQPSPRMYQQLLESFVVPGSLPLREARGLGAAIEGLATPLGLVELKRGSYLFSPDMSRHPLLSFLFSLLRPAGTVPGEEVVRRLEKGPFGLPHDTTLFLLAALAVGGLITMRRSGRAISLDLLSLQSPEKAEEIALGELIGENDRQLLQEQCTFLGEAGQWESFGLRQQREAWSEVIKFRAAAERLGGDVLDRLRQRKGYTSFRGFRFTVLEEKLEAAGRLAGEIRVSYSAKEGLEKFLTAWRGAGLTAEDVPFLQKLGRFLVRGAEKLVFVSHYVGHGASEAISRMEPELAESRRRILEMIESPEETIFADEGAHLDELFGAYREGHLRAYTKMHDAYYEARKPPKLSKNAARAQTVLQRLAGVEALDRPPGLERFLSAMASSGRETCRRPVREELMRGPVCGCGFLPGQQPAAAEVEDPEGRIEGFLREYLRILREPRILESLASHAYALRDVNPQLSGQLKKVGSDLGSGNSSASTLVKSCDETTVRELAGALSGRIKLQRRSLGDLAAKLAGRRLPPARIEALVAQWLGDREEGTLIAVDELEGGGEAARSAEAGWWALLHPELFGGSGAAAETESAAGAPGGGAAAAASAAGQMEESLEEAFPAERLREALERLGEEQLLDFIRSEAFHTGAVRAAWKLLTLRVLQGRGGALPGASRPASRHVLPGRAREIERRAAALQKAAARMELPFPGRLGTRLPLEELLMDPWIDDGLQTAVFDWLREAEKLSSDWLAGLQPVPAVDLAEGPLVFVVDAVPPDVWLEALGLTEADGGASEGGVASGAGRGVVAGAADAAAAMSTSWNRLEAPPETPQAMARLLGLEGDPVDGLASQGIPYVSLRGTEERPLLDLLEPFTPGRAAVVRLSGLDKAAHAGATRLGSMAVRLEQLLARELPNITGLCREQSRPLVMTTDHGLSLDRSGLKHGGGGVYERAIFRARWDF